MTAEITSGTDTLGGWQRTPSGKLPETPRAHNRPGKHNPLELTRAAGTERGLGGKEEGKECANRSPEMHEKNKAFNRNHAQDKLGNQ